MSAAITIAIPTYGRDTVLVDSCRALCPLLEPEDELILVDQTPAHPEDTQQALAALQNDHPLVILKEQPPSVTRAMNAGLLRAKNRLVLFLDDDIVPGEALLAAHRSTFDQHPDAWVSAGQVLQPGEEPEALPRPPVRSGLRADLGFPFRSTGGCWIENLMAGNMCVNRQRALDVGGFDGRFMPPVSYRFETEFAKRLVEAGGRIRFQPLASIHHLRSPRGGTRSHGSHLASASPIHGEGDYYYALRRGYGWDRIRHLATRPFREVRTRFHLCHPWWIPVKLVGELRAMRRAFALWRAGPQLLQPRGDEAP